MEESKNECIRENVDGGKGISGDVPKDVIVGRRKSIKVRRRN